MQPKAIEVERGAAEGCTQRMVRSGRVEEGKMKEEWDLLEKSMAR